MNHYLKYYRVSAMLRILSMCMISGCSWEQTRVTTTGCPAKSREGVHTGTRPGSQCYILFHLPYLQHSRQVIAEFTVLFLVKSGYGYKNFNLFTHPVRSQEIQPSTISTYRHVTKKHVYGNQRRGERVV